MGLPGVEMFLHPVGVFSSYLEALSSNIGNKQKIDAPVYFRIFNSRYTAPAADISALPEPGRLP